MNLFDLFKRKKELKTEKYGQTIQTVIVPENIQNVNIPVQDELEGREVYTWKQLKEAVWNEQQKPDTNIKKQEKYMKAVNEKRHLFQYANMNCAICGEIKSKDQFSKTYITDIKGESRTVCDECGK